MGMRKRTDHPLVIKKKKKLVDPSWVILTICEPWEIAPNEAPPAIFTVHALEGWEEDIQTKLTVKFHGQPPPDAPGSGGSGGGGHCESQEVFQFSGHFPAISGHPIALFHHFWTP